MTWLDEHLETFVRPYLGEVPNVDKQHVWVKTFSPKLLAGMLAIWNRTKVLAKGRTILLPGRDVYLFEVIARMQGDYPTIFRPDISSSVAPYVVEDYKETFVLDTGYKGSVPKAMGIPNWVLIRYDFGGRPVDLVKQYQVFPTIKRGAMMSLSSFLEGCPKYWDRANMAPNQGYKGGAIRQVVNEKSIFKVAAMLTIHVAQSTDMFRVVLKRYTPPVRPIRPIQPFGRLL